MLLARQEAGMNSLNGASLRRLFPGRLSRPLAKGTVARTEEEQKRVTWAILSTCRDCRQLGLEPDARRILSARRPQTSREG
jgi:hypothetical protein